MVQEKNIVVQIILSLVTCGIYGIYWFITLTDDVALLNENKDFSGVKSLIFTLITCGIYGIYWNYKIGKEMYEANKKNNITGASDNSIAYLILSLFGLSIITYCLVQNEINNIAVKNVEE